MKTLTLSIILLIFYSCTTQKPFEKMGDEEKRAHLKTKVQEWIESNPEDNKTKLWEYISRKEGPTFDEALSFYFEHGDFILNDSLIEFRVWIDLEPGRTIDGNSKATQVWPEDLIKEDADHGLMVEFQIVFRFSNQGAITEAEIFFDWVRNGERIRNQCVDCPDLLSWVRK